MKWVLHIFLSFFYCFLLYGMDEVQQTKQRLKQIFGMAISYPLKSEFLKAYNELQPYTNAQVKQMSDDEIRKLPNVWVIKEVSKSINNGDLSEEYVDKMIKDYAEKKV